MALPKEINCGEILEFSCLLEVLSLNLNMAVSSLLDHSVNCGACRPQ